MQAFKCALRVMRAHIVFPLVYIVGLSFMGVFMAMSLVAGQQSDEFEPAHGEFAIVDRDGSALSGGIADALGEQGEAVDIADSREAFQDAVAKGTVDYLLVVPEGYGEAFMDAVRAGEGPPTMDTMFSYYSMEGAYFDEAVSSYLSAARSLALAQPDAGQDAVVAGALDAVGHRAQASILQTETSASEADRFAFYLTWSTYTLFAGVTVCIGVLTTTLGRTELRRRALISPMPFLSHNLQVGLACLIVTLTAWAWSFAIGLVAFPAAVAEMTLPGIAWCALSVLAFCMIPLGIGFLLGQCGASIAVSNAVGNICGMVVSFLGGAWVPLSIMSPEIISMARCLPGYWYNEAVQLSVRLGSTPSSEAVVLIAQQLGVLLLFAAAIFAAGLVVSRLRTQTAEAGGNAAAEAALTV